MQLTNRYYTINTNWPKDTEECPSIQTVGEESTSAAYGNSYKIGDDISSFYRLQEVKCHHPYKLTSFSLSGHSTILFVTTICYVTYCDSGTFLAHLLTRKKLLHTVVRQTCIKKSGQENDKKGRASTRDSFFRNQCIF